MNDMVKLLGVAVIGAVFIPAAEAQTATDSARTAILNGDMVAAESGLIAERRIFPDRPELMLNLAAVYARTDRPALAADLYREVLSRADVLMDLTAERSASSHAIARLGLERIGRIRTAAR